MAREKRPQHRHNFKAGSMNALIRVSSVISNAPIILNLDCDMYANNTDAIREALCFFMDEERGHETAYVQFPQNFNNITPNDLYFNSCTVINEVEMKGLDGAGNGTTLYCGTGCFHRRESLCGRMYSEDYKPKLTDERTEMKRSERTVVELEEAAKAVANCSYEEGTPWGKEMGVMYGCSVEDIVTGITIQCRGWKSIYYNPRRKAFIGVAPNTLELCLVQFKRWSEGLFQIFLSKYCPFTLGHGKIKVGAQMAYSFYLVWASLSLPTLFYVIVPPLFLLRGIPLFPEVSLSSLWFLPFIYAVLARSVSSMAEALGCGLTVWSWWNAQRMLLFRRTSAFVFALVDAVLAELGLSQTGFAVTAKTVTPDVQARYEKEVMEFGSSSVMFTLIATLGVLNLFCLIGGLMRVGLVYGLLGLGRFMVQFVVAGAVVSLNLPVYKALFIRHDRGCLPMSVMFKSVVFASTGCVNYV
ncbi:hypothetical protein CRG98_023360 [Punica granatum]|uniref:Cellulose synthase-like protein E6 n=1 Tax=Punica granatum TaxID=22663 RepID=A0A2I0JJ88_PUNGR|nr:hypothetical protein CRG98_023360 [Punica granatum]